MKKQSLFYGISGLLIGALLSGLVVWSVKENSYDQKNKISSSDSSMTMQQMANMLKNKTGDEFDEEFIAGMIEHHQGAIDMADLAKKHAKHDEIKKMADDIIAAQSKEITMMQSWRTQWGYKDQTSSRDMNMMNH